MLGHDRIEMPSVEDCVLVPLQRIVDERGTLTVVEEAVQCPFDIKRIFFMQDVPLSQVRGGHAHKALHQFVICMAGEFLVEVTDGLEVRQILLGSPESGLHIPPGIWAVEREFSPGAICLVAASDTYSESDYIRDFESFRLFRKGVWDV